MHIQLYIILNIMWGRLMNWMMMSACCDNNGTICCCYLLDIINLNYLFFFFRQRLFTKELNLFYQSPKSDRNNLEFK